MSSTIVDMPKVTQMLDACWTVQLNRCGLGSYAARAKHENAAVVERLAQTFPFTDQDGDEGPDWDDGWLITDDFTPEQALTRLAYKVRGEIILADGRTLFIHGCAGHQPTKEGSE